MNEASMHSEGSNKSAPSPSKGKWIMLGDEKSPYPQFFSAMLLSPRRRASRKEDIPSPCLCLPKTPLLLATSV